MERVLFGRSQFQKLARALVEDEPQRRSQLHGATPVEVDLAGVVGKTDDPVFAVAWLEPTHRPAPTQSAHSIIALQLDERHPRAILEELRDRLWDQIVSAKLTWICSAVIFFQPAPLGLILFE